MRRFVIIAAPRSGSTFLVRALDSHPRVQCRGELFRLTPANIDSIVADPHRYCERALQPESSSIEASGFKLFYEHMTYEGYFEPPLFLKKNEEEGVTRISENRSAVRKSLLQQFSGTDELRTFFSEFWGRLREDTNLTIVHLVRRDYLSSLYSLKRAFVSDHWAFDPTSTGPGQTSASLALEPAYCESYFDFMERGMQLTRSMSSGHPSLELVFESLCASPREELDRVYEVLGVPPIAEPVVGPTRTSHHERISNFETLRKYFSDTRWSSLFDPSM